MKSPTKPVSVGNYTGHCLKLFYVERVMQPEVANIGDFRASFLSRLWPKLQTQTSKAIDGNKRLIVSVVPPKVSLFWEAFPVSPTHCPPRRRWVFIRNLQVSTPHVTSVIPHSKRTWETKVKSIHKASLAMYVGSYIMVSWLLSVSRGAAAQTRVHYTTYTTRCWVFLAGTRVVSTHALTLWSCKHPSRSMSSP